MQLSHPVIHLFSAPTTAIGAVLPDAADPLWDEFAMRQTIYRAHNATRSIVFAWSDIMVGGRAVVMRPTYAPPDLANAAWDYASRFAAHYDYGEVVRLLLAELPVGGAIKRHRDSGHLLTAVHRCHAAVETNPDVQFLIDDVARPFWPGEAYEVDNTRPHEVRNEGLTRRVHLICDILPPQSIL